MSSPIVSEKHKIKKKEKKKIKENTTKQQKQRIKRQTKMMSAAVANSILELSNSRLHF